MCVVHTMYLVCVNTFMDVLKLFLCTQKNGTVGQQVFLFNQPEINQIQFVYVGIS